MKFEDVYGRWQQRRLSQAQAAEILGMSERSFRRWRDRYDEAGLDGLADRRLGRASARRVPVDQVDQMLSLYRARYPGFTVKHFHDKLRQHHGFQLSYSWTVKRHREVTPWRHEELTPRVGVSVSRQACPGSPREGPGGRCGG